MKIILHKYRKIKLGDRKGFEGEIKFIRITKAKVIKLSDKMKADKRQRLKKLKIEYKIARNKILNEQWEIINDKLKQIK